jgi:ABC-type amino acid transport substrate-binding protein
MEMRGPMILLSLVFVAAGAWACGDKMMLVMGARSSRIKPIHPALILAYPGQNASATLIRDLQRQLAVRKSRHRIQIVEDRAALESALKAGQYDLVLADVANANELNQRVMSAPSKPVILPVAFQASKEDQSAAEKKYHCLLKAPGSPDNYLDAIDRAMDWKLKAINR